jgi:hypothetical protein
MTCPESRRVPKDTVGIPGNQETILCKPILIQQGGELREFAIPG